MDRMAPREQIDPSDDRPMHYLSLFAWNEPNKPAIGTIGHVYTYDMHERFFQHHWEQRETGLLLWAPEELATMYEHCITEWLRHIGPFN